MNIVIDSSVLIDYLRGGQKWQDFLQAAPNAKLFLPTAVIFELYAGKSSMKVSAQENIAKLLYKFNQVELTGKIAQHAGELYRDVEIQLGPVDYIIAATAIEMGAYVLTMNAKDFQQIPGVALYPL